jgi:pyridoxine 5-phosphate synthase
MATKLSVNLNKVATLRNTRSVGIPSVTRCARLCLSAGADGITIHPRPNQRHIRRDDVEDLARLVADHPGVELNIEGNPFHDLLSYVEAHRPSQCTLVPDDEGQATSDHGWDLAKNGARLAPILKRLRELDVRSSLFMDADASNMRLAKDIGADRVELYTEPYAAAFTRGDCVERLGACRDAAEAAGSAGLGVNAGHDLNLANLGPFLASVPGILEVSIGHALIADALEYGLADTVRRYLEIAAREREPRFNA